MAGNVTQKLIRSHLVEGEMAPGQEIALRIDQTLTQDATAAAGPIGMLAIGAGGLEVALAMAGYPFYVKMPQIWGVWLVGELPDWVSPKDVVLEMLRRHNVDGAVGRIIEYHGPGLRCLS